MFLKSRYVACLITFFLQNFVPSNSFKFKTMKFIFCLLSLFTVYSYAQVQAVGIIVEFNENVNFEHQAEIFGEINGLKTLKANHLLTGFEITLIETEEELSEAAIKMIQETIELDDHVAYTSILYKTEQGAYGGDLNELYVKSSNENFHLANREKFELKSLKKHHVLSGVWIYEFDKNSTPIREARAMLKADKSVEYACINAFHSVLVTSDDTYFDYQWALDNQGTAIQYDGTAGADMQVEEAWGITDGAGIKVAVLDSGTDTNHVDLVGALLPGFDATGGGSKGYPNTTYSNDGHGTCTAGIIGAIANNDEGIAGVAQGSMIIPIKIFYYIEFAGEVIPFTSSEAGTDGIIWAVNTAGADILSNSWGLRESDIVLLGIDVEMSNAIMDEGILEGRGGKGCPMLFSSGNEADSFSIWPAAQPNTISVGASTMCDELKKPTDCSPEGWWGSNYGENLDVTAPGVKVLTTDMSDDLGYNDFGLDNNYSLFNGTSAACPNAAGVVALIMDVDPSLTSLEVRGILSVTADKTGGYSYDASGDFGTWSDEMGYGRVNAFEAVQYASVSSEIKKNKQVLERIIYSNQGTALQLNSSENRMVSIYTLTGLLIHSFQTSYQITSLSALIQSPGMYLIQIEKPDENVTLKAIIN